MTLFVRNLIDADAFGPRERVHPFAFVHENALEHLAHGSPGDAKQLADRASVGRHGEAGDQIFERPRNARSSSRPRYPRDDNAVVSANHTRRSRLEDDLGETGVGCPPGTQAFPAVVASAAEVRIIAFER